MKKLFKNFIIIVLLLIFPKVGECGFGVGIENFTKFEYDIVSLLEFGAGFSAGLVGHEMAHRTVADVENLGIVFSGFRSDLSIGSDSQYLNISLGGFGSEIIGSEIFFNKKYFPKKSPIILGYLVFNTLHPLLYVFEYEFMKSEYESDLVQIKNNGGNVGAVEMIILTHALWNVWRLYGGSETIEFLSTKYCKASPHFMTQAPKWENNFQVTFHYGVKWQF